MAKVIQDASDTWMSPPFSDTLPNAMITSRERCAPDQTRPGERFLNWAKSRPDIRAVALVGSGARDDHPADQWSDLDFVIVASDAQSLLSSTDWLADIGASWFSIVERSPSGEAIERRVLFEDGCDMDFIIVSSESARGGFPGTFVKEIASRGVRVLLDRDAVLASLPGLARPTPPSSLPSFQDFSETVSDFWFHAVWTAKKLKRGELWVAKCRTRLIG
jgi:aminoglycoside 6-adenylyltransferase